MPYISDRMLPDWPAWNQILYCMSGCRAQLAPVQCTSNSKTSGRRQNGTSQCSATSQAGTNGLFGCWFNAVFPEPPKNPTAFGNQQYTTVQPLTAFNTWETFALYSNFIKKPCSVGNNCWQTDKENTFSSKSKKGKKKCLRSYCPVSEAQWYQQGTDALLTHLAALRHPEGTHFSFQ